MNFKEDNGMTFFDMAVMTGISTPNIRLICLKDEEDLGKMYLKSVVKIKATTGVDLLEFLSN